MTANRWIRRTCMMPHHRKSEPVTEFRTYYRLYPDDQAAIDSEPKLYDMFRIFRAARAVRTEGNPLCPVACSAIPSAQPVVIG